MIEYANVTRLGAPCARCGSLLQLIEGAENTVECPLCPSEPGEGATVADALEDWHAHNPPPAIAAVSELAYFKPKRQPWVIECDGLPFATLSEAESYIEAFGDAPLPPIYCRLADSGKKAKAS